MLKKNNKILVGCLALLLVMAVGYALFSETITINGTATAKGEFDMTVTCEKGLSNVFSKNEVFAYGLLGLNASRYKYNDNNFKNDSCSVSGNNVTYSVELTQPKAERTFTIKITNNGSIDSILNFETGLTGSLQRCEGNFETDEFSNCSDELNGRSIINMEIIAFEDIEGNVYKNLYGDDSILDWMHDFIDEDPYAIKLSPGASVYILAIARWDDNSSDLGFNPGNKAYYKDTMNISFTFTQPKVQ